MRKLMWFTVGFATACAVAAFVYLGLWGLLLAVLCLGLSFALHSVGTTKSKVTSLILLGVAAGSLWVSLYNLLYLDTARNYHGKSVEGNVIITDYSYLAKSGMAADGYIKLSGKYYKIRIYYSGEEPFQPGDGLSGDVLLKLTSAGMKDSTYRRGDGALLEGYMDAVIMQPMAAPFWIRFPAELRKDIIQTIDALFPEDVAGFARALLIGDTGALGYIHDVSMQISGIRHVVAVSGLHVSILFSFAYTVSGKRGIWSAILGIPLLVLFAAVAGFTPSIVRACLMQILMILSLLLNKEYDPPTSLATAVLCMLFFEPMMITSVSLQLSAGCVIGIFLFFQSIHDWILRGKLKKLAKGKRFFAKMLRWMVSTVAVSVSATVATTPLVAYYFGTVSLVGVLTNLLTLWVISFVFYGIILACMFSLVTGTGAAIVAWIVAWPIRYVLIVSKYLARLPLSAVYTCSCYIVIWLVMSYVLLIVFLRSRKKHPYIYSGCVIVGLALAIFAGWLEPVIMSIHTTALDVGQGQCILLFSESGNYMVDCGGDHGKSVADKAAKELLTRGITCLDGLILTHYDTDHAGGAAYFLARFPVDQLYFPDVDHDSSIRADLEQIYDSSITWISDALFLDLGESRLWLYPGLDGENENESCLSVLFQMENYDILITGDLSIAGENALLEKYPIPELDVLVVGHHGCDTSTGKRLLGQTMPRQAVISVGEDNSHGHPSRIVTERLKFYGCRIWRTDLDGTIDIRG